MNPNDISARMALTLKRLFRVEDVRGDPFVVDGRKLIPVSQRIQIGGAAQVAGGGFVWNRPIAVTEELGDGIYRHHHIHDETLRALVSIAVGALIFRLVLGLMLRRR